MEHETRNTIRDIFLLMALALAVRLLFMLAMPRVVDTADAIHYIENAQRILTWDWAAYDPKIPIGYPLISALFGLFIADMEWACRMASLCFSVLLVLPVYRLSHAMHGQACARFAAILVSVWPWLADYGCRVGTEALAVFCWAMGVWALYWGINTKSRLRWIWPLSLALLWLIRAEGMFIYLAACFPLLILAQGQRPRHLAIYAAWGVGVFFFSMGLNQFLVDTASANYRVGFIVDEFNLFRFVDASLKSITEVLPIMLGPVLMGLIGAGLVVANQFNRNIKLECTILYFAAIQWLVTLPVLSPAPRYLMAPIIMLSLWTAPAVIGALRHWKDKPFGTVLRYIPAAVALGFMLIGMVTTLGAEHVGRRPREPYEYKIAGQWMKTHLEPGLIFTRKPQVGFYANMPSTGPAMDDTLEVAIARAQEANAQYLVIDERYGLASMTPLLDPAAAPPALKHLESFDTYPDARVVIYQLVDQP